MMIKRLDFMEMIIFSNDLSANPRHAVPPVFGSHSSKAPVEPLRHRSWRISPAVNSVDDTTKICNISGKHVFLAVKRPLTANPSILNVDTIEWRHFRAQNPASWPECPP